MKQWHVPNVEIHGEVFRWWTPISGLLFKDYLRRADVPETDPIRLPYKHIYITWYEKRRGEAAKETVCKSGNKRYPRLRSSWHLEIASIQWLFFFWLPPVTGYCWFLSGCKTMRCSAVWFCCRESASDQIGSPICRIAGTRDADVTSCFRMPLRGSNETVVKHVIPTSLQLCSGFFTICGLICFLPLGLWPPSTSKNLATLLPAFCMCQCAQVTSMVLMRHFWPLVCMRCPVWSSSLFPVSPGSPVADLRISSLPSLQQ